MATLLSHRIDGSVVHEAGEMRPEDAPTAAADMTIAKAISETLQRHYPRHPWAVGVDSTQGVAYVQLPILSRRLGVVIKLKSLAGDPQMRTAVQAGGKLLEFWDIPRGEFDGGQYRAASPGSHEFGRP